MKKFILSNQTNNKLLSLNGLITILNNIANEYKSAINEKISEENTRLICFAKDKLMLFNDDFKLKNKTEQNSLIFNEFNNNNIYIDYSETISLLSSTYENNNIYLFEFNHNNEHLYNIVKKYLNENLSIELCIEIKNNIHVVKLTNYIEINDVDKILFNEKYMPNNISRVKEQAYNLLIQSNKPNSNFEAMNIKNKIESGNLNELSDIFLKISNLMGVSLSLKELDFKINNKTPINKK